jgi:hypothetical protein
MGLDPQSYKADALANLYRASLFLTRGQVKTGISFLGKALPYFEESMPDNLKELIDNKQILNSREQQLFWAEKILDCYHLLQTIH